MSESTPRSFAAIQKKLHKVGETLESLAAVADNSEQAKRIDGLCNLAGQLTYKLVAAGVIDLADLPNRFREWPAVPEGGPVYVQGPETDGEELVTREADFSGVWWVAFVAWLASRMDAPVVLAETATRDTCLDFTEGLAFWDIRYPDLSNAGCWVAIGRASIQAIEYLQTDCAAANPPEIPPFDPASGEWVKANEAATVTGLEIKTLREYRRKGHDRYVADDDMSGIDPDGRKWRKPTTEKSHPLYYRPSLGTS